MGLKDFNYKQLLLDRGERIGLGAAAVIALFLVATLFIIPGMGFLSGSSGSNADALATATKSVQNGLVVDKPTEADAPGDPTNKLTAFNFGILDEDQTKKYAIAEMFTPIQQGVATRQMPDLLQPKESRTAIVRLQVPSLVFSGERLLVLDDASTTGAPGSKMMGSMPNAKKIQDLYGQTQMSSFNPAMMKAGPGMGRRNPSRGNEADDAEDLKSHYEEGKNIGSFAEKKLAEQTLPVRAAEIVASFPYKAQVQEFQDKLGLSDTQVLNELSLETNKDKTPLNAFRFLGVRLERRQVDSQGKAIDEQGRKVDDKGGWAEVDLEKSFGALVFLDGRRFEEEDPKLTPVILSNRLVMRKLLTFGDRRVPPLDEYPKIEEEMPGLKATLETFKEDPNAVPAGPSIINRDFSVFDLDTGAAPQMMQPGMSGRSPMGMTPSSPPPGASSSNGLPPGASPSFGARPFNPGSFASPNGSPEKGTGGYGAGFLQAGQKFTVPEYCLIRLFDVTIKPGKTYEYRMQVRMGNPNYGRPDAATQGYAHLPELPPKDWYVLPEKVKAPTDLNYYAVNQVKVDADQAKQDAKEIKEKDPTQPKEPPQPKEAKLPVQPVKENQTVLQIQKWLEFQKIKGVDEGIADWVIAERVVATRGEPIGPQKVEVPYWRKTQDRFTLASEGPSKRGRRAPPTVEVAFADGDPPVLVDFTGGDVTYTRARPKTDTAPAAGQAPPIKDSAAVEVLLLMPDGTLAAHDSAKDAADPDRISRLKEEREWIHNVKNTKGGKDQSTPFGPPNGAS
jgi:hypothetical protein